MKVLDLFSGIGGFSLGLERAGFETVAFCEYDKAAQKVLNLRWPNVPIYPDIRELKGDEITSDVITGGYPCQPFSVAGKRGGATDDRHLWPEMYRIIKAVRPRWVIAENVAGHISMGLDSVLSDLEAENYTCWPFVIPACAVDAKHRRDRVWIVAQSSGERCNNGRDHRQERQVLSDIDRDAEKGKSARNGRVGGIGETGSDVGDTERSGREGQSRRRAGKEPKNGHMGMEAQIMGDSAEQGLQNRRSAQVGRSETIKESQRSDSELSASRWAAEPAVGRVANGIPRRVDRLKQLGNSVVPQIPEIIGRAIMKSEAG